MSERIVHYQLYPGSFACGPVDDVANGGSPTATTALYLVTCRACLDYIADLVEKKLRSFPLRLEHAIVRVHVPVSGVNVPSFIAFRGQAFRRPPGDPYETPWGVDGPGPGAVATEGDVVGGWKRIDPDLDDDKEED